MSDAQTVYFPFDEMHTPLLPVTEGCGHNKCTFCTMYKDDFYCPVDKQEWSRVLKNMDPLTERVFLTGADPLEIGFTKMQEILKDIKRTLPYCFCVAAYASVRTINRYSLEELKALKTEGLGLLYIGFESGDDQVLQRVNKGHTVDMAVAQGKKLNEAKLPFVSIVMYGIAGCGKGIAHGKKTAQMLNQFYSAKIVTMNLTLFAFSLLAQEKENGVFVEASVEEKKEELYLFLLTLKPNCAREVDTTHPTNIVRLRDSVLKVQKEVLLRTAKRES